MMRRGSKYNPYQCPECGYETPRKWNMKVHLERVHGLAPFLPEQSRKKWVYAQLQTLARQYAEAELAGDRERRDRLWNSLISLYNYHRGLFPIECIPQAIAEERHQLERRIGKSRK